MNNLILKQQISENADVQLLLVGTFQAVLPACLVPTRASATEGAHGPLCTAEGGSSTVPPSLLEWGLQDLKGMITYHYLTFMSLQ